MNHLVSYTDSAPKELQQQSKASLKGDDGKKLIPAKKPHAVLVASRPDSGGREGSVISLLANHFLVQFDPSQKIYHYNVEITPHPSKDVARAIKQKLVNNNSAVLCGATPSH